jgi:hypothetical protein
LSPDETEPAETDALLFTDFAVAHGKSINFGNLSTPAGPDQNSYQIKFTTAGASPPGAR